MNICYLFSNKGYFVTLNPKSEVLPGLEINETEGTWKYVDPTDQGHSTQKTYKIGQSVKFTDKSWVRGVYDADNFSHMRAAVEKASSHYDENPGGNYRRDESIS
jgi:hypothetical protein